MVGVGKIADIFAGRGVARVDPHRGERATACARRWRRCATLDRGLVFVNLVDFDMLYGHRRDAPGSRARSRIRRAGCPSSSALRPGDAVFITADHGNDPTTPGTDHTREYVPLLAFGPRRPAGARSATRTTFCDLGATIAEGLGVAPLATGRELPGRAGRAARRRRHGVSGGAARDAAADPHKRDGGELDDGDIRAFIAGAAAGDDPRLPAVGAADGDLLPRHDDARARRRGRRR